MERDDEISGQGNIYDFGDRLNSVRLGKWFTPDKSTALQPNWSPYKVNFDNPILYKDPDGKKEFVTIIITDEKTGKTTTLSTIMSNKIFPKHDAIMNEAPYEWYDKQTTFNYTVDANSNVKLTSYSTQLVNEKDNGKPLVTTSFNSQTWAKGLLKLENITKRGDGGIQKGGFHLVSEGGGADPTKFKSLNYAEQIDYDVISNVMTAFGAMTSDPANIKEIFNEPLDFANRIQKTKDLLDVGKETKEQLFPKKTLSRISWDYVEKGSKEKKYLIFKSGYSDGTNKFDTLDYNGKEGNGESYGPGLQTLRDIDNGVKLDK